MLWLGAFAAPPLKDWRRCWTSTWRLALSAQHLSSSYARTARSIVVSRGKNEKRIFIKTFVFVIQFWLLLWRRWASARPIDGFVCLWSSDGALIYCRWARSNKSATVATRANQKGATPFGGMGVGSGHEPAQHARTLASFMYSTFILSLPKTNDLSLTVDPPNPFAHARAWSIWQ